MSEISKENPRNKKFKYKFFAIMFITIAFPLTIATINFVFRGEIAKRFSISDSDVFLISIAIFTSGMVISHQLYLIYNEKLTSEKLEDIAHQVVRDNILPKLDERYGFLRDIIVTEVDNKYLSYNQKKMKEDLFGYAKERHAVRVSALQANSWISIYNFKIVKRLLEFLFRTNSSEQCRLYDFTVAYNADQMFRGYSFEEYFKNLFALRDDKMMCKTHIHILIFCDLDMNQKSVAAQKIDSELWYAQNNDAAHSLESSLKGIFLEYCSRFDIETDNLAEIYDDISNDDKRDISLRLITRDEIEKMDIDSPKMFEQPFNVYDDICVSRSIVRNFENSGERPVPHVEITLNTDVVDEFASLFKSMWNQSGRNISGKFKDGEKLAELGSGQNKFIRQWIGLE